jgi:hypothetical protein
VTNEDKWTYFNTVYSYTWRTITRLVQQVAYQLHSKQNASNPTEEEPIIIMPQPKKAEHHDPTLVLLQSIMTGQATTTSS